MCSRSNADVAWKVLADLSSIQYWSTDVKSVSVPRDMNQGFGFVQIQTRAEKLHDEWVDHKIYALKTL